MTTTLTDAEEGTEKTFSVDWNSLTKLFWSFFELCSYLCQMIALKNEDEALWN